MKMNLKFCLNSLFLLFNFIKNVENTDTYVQPLAGGLQMAIPYDISNFFKRPIAGTVGVILNLSLGGILLFGVFTAPFGYFFGIPSRKYVLGSEDNTIVRSIFDYPTFEQSVFYFISDEETAGCKQFILCSAHSVLNVVPKSILQYYMIFSKRFLDISAEYKEAIVSGLKRGTDCKMKYKNCGKSQFDIVISSLLNLLPTSSKKKLMRTF